MAPMVVAHETSGGARYLEAAAALALSWKSAETVNAGKDFGLYWNDMGSGIRASKLAYLLQHGRAARLPQQDLAALQALAQQHLDRLGDPAFLGQSNHAFFQIHGLRALSLAAPELEGAAAAHAYAGKALLALLKQQFGEEGVHLEHSPGYHVFALRTLRRMLATGFYEDLPDAFAVLKRARRLATWLTFPDGMAAAFGDTDRDARRLTYRPAKRAARLFREAGYAVVRAPASAPHGPAVLMVAAGHHSNVHKHADDLSFELYDRGRHWIVDTGKYSYSKADWRAYTDSARAHNTVEYDPASPGNGVRRTPPAGGMLHALRQQGDAWIIEGRVERPVVGAAHARRFTYRPGESLLIEDLLTFDDARDAVAWLHLPPDLEAEQTSGGWRFPGGRILYASDVPLTLIRARGATEPEIQGWLAEGYHRITPNDALGARFHGRRIRLSTSLVFD